jgi:hypothetical protein
MAEGFIAASSDTPMMPRVRRLSTNSTDRMSDSANNSDLETARTPCSAARSGVRFWLQAMTSMSKASPTLATADPSRPSPIRPRVLPAKPIPTVLCHPPPATEANSVGRFRAAARIMAQVCSDAALARYPVAHTVIPSAAAAVRSIAALR